LSIFTVQPSTPYNISIGQPGVSGTPTPTVSYAWTYNGTAIGGNSRFVNGYTFPSLPGTIACTITLTNIAGSVSQTVTASIQQASNAPTLSPVTIRDNASPTAPISTIANGNAGVVLRVGGPTAPDVNPIATNATTVSYQWRRGASNIAGATAQTYTLAAADEDSTISVVVTATNLEGSVSQSSVVTVGAPAVKVPRGDHLSPIDYYSSGVTFANLIYSSIGSVAGIRGSTFVGRGVAGGGEAVRFGQGADWATAREICTEDGWPYRSLTGDITGSAACRTALCGGGFPQYRWWSILELPVSWNGTARTVQDPDNERLFASAPDSIAGKRFKYDISVYWEGTGYACAVIGNGAPSGTNKPAVQQVTFAQSPFDDGRTNVVMSKTTRTLLYPMAADGTSVAVADLQMGGGGTLMSQIYETDPTNTDPLRNMIVLISNVREVDAQGNTIEQVYAGFDESNYHPFAMYPSAKARYQRASHLRTLQMEHARSPPSAYDSDIASVATGETWEVMNARNLDISEWPVHKAVVDATKHPCGAELGWRAIERPTHSAFGRSLRAVIEVCKQCDCDLWWCHPYMVVSVGTQTESGTVLATKAPSLQGGWNPPDVNDPTQAGVVIVDQDYIEYFNEVIQRLPAGRKVYSEYANECWNNKVSYKLQHFYSYNMVQRIMAEAQYGGDGNVLMYRSGNRTIAATGRFAGTQTNPVGNRFGIMMSAIAAAHIAKALRADNAPREIVSVIGGWFNGAANSYQAIENAFALQPYLLKHIDAIAPAPYNAPCNFHLGRPGDPLFGSRAEALVYLGGWEASWQFVIDTNKVLEPWTDAGSYWNMAGTKNSRPNRQRNELWKHIALDKAYSVPGAAGSANYARTLPSGWPSARRRWNWKLLAYECGTETDLDPKPAAPPEIRAEAFKQTLEFHTYEAQQGFNRRYLEMLFSPSIRGEVTAAAAGSEDESLYMPGRVPAGIAAEQEPLYDAVTHLLTVEEMNEKATVIWSDQLSSRHDSPMHRGALDAINRGVGLPNWWVGYDYGD
jgi:hypothetical protein